MSATVSWLPVCASVVTGVWDAARVSFPRVRAVPPGFASAVGFAILLWRVGNWWHQLPVLSRGLCPRGLGSLGPGLRTELQQGRHSHRNASSCLNYYTATVGNPGGSVLGALPLLQGVKNQSRAFADLESHLWQKGQTTWSFQLALPNRSPS